MTREEAAACAQKAANATKREHYAWTFDGRAYRVGPHLPMMGRASASSGWFSYMLFMPQEVPQAREAGVQKRGIARHYR